MRCTDHRQVLGKRSFLQDPDPCRGKILTLIYKGPYACLHEAWSWIGAYAEERKFSIAGPPRELYLNDPSEIEESELLTELQIPLDPVLHGE